ncbi:MAG: hypothetical protein LBO71_06570 [Prevotellaceae bacterium]|nr:hypothetical protein [Prevotellaceae bacterium]
MAGVASSKTYFFNFKILFTMKTLDLNAYGVYEMNDVEMQNTDGGLAWWIAVGATLAGTAILAWIYGYF